jgi:acyl-coenzyme A synthetase/AMP-(fatty) acid ligase
MRQKLNPYEYVRIRAERNPDACFIYTQERSPTNLETYDTVRKIASYFRHLGVKQGDVIALNMPSPLHIVFMLATWHEGAISAAYSSSINHQLTTWKPDWLFSNEHYEAGSAKNVVKVDANTFHQIESLEFAKNPRQFNSKRDYIRILFSSGTTGTPKGVPLSIEVLENRAAIRRELWLKHGNFASLFDIGSLGGFGTFHGQLISGDPYVPPATPSINARNILKLSIQHIQGSPNQISALADIVQQHEYKLDSLKLVTVAGSAITPFMMRKIQKILHSRVQNLYASTEGGVVSFRTEESHDPQDLGTILSNVSVQIVDEANSQLDFEKVGRIRVKSSETVDEYFRDPEATMRFFKDGWFYSGDLGRVSRSGKLFLEGRDDELVNFGGLKIDPMKIDSFIVGQLNVVDAGSFGFRDSQGIQSFAVAVVLERHSDLGEISKLLQSHFGTSAPRFVFQIKEIPRNERGKVDRLKLSADFLASRQ